MFKGELEKSLSFIILILVSFSTNYIKISKKKILDVNCLEQNILIL